MVNSRAIGNKTQRELIKHLKGQGWRVSKVETGNMYSKERDAFGLFDLLCINNTKLMLAQVTTNCPHVHRNYKDFSEDHRISGVEYEQWVWYSRRGWKRFIYREGKMKIVDYRKPSKKKKKKSTKKS